MIAHGTTSSYVNHKCRCDPCKRAQSEYMRTWSKRARQRTADQIPHGLGGYKNYRCRCEVCRAASTEYEAIRRASR
ncbi:hypothetical protein [Roseateles sp.]|uniref:hypothetical protein n=1 Tax=Roseateles sp. TaxID=1971397 RepID=UPI002F3E8DFC